MAMCQFVGCFYELCMHACTFHSRSINLGYCTLFPNIRAWWLPIVRMCRIKQLVTISLEGTGSKLNKLGRRGCFELMG